MDKESFPRNLFRKQSIDGKISFLRREFSVPAKATLYKGKRDYTFIRNGSSNQFYMKIRLMIHLIESIFQRHPHLFSAKHSTRHHQEYILLVPQDRFHHDP